MNIPFSVHEGVSSKSFLFFTGLAIALMLILNLVGAPLTTPQAPAGIVSFELARTPAKAQAILSSWNSAAQLRAAFSLGLDYLFMPAYAAAISLGCLLSAGVLRRKGWPLVRMGKPLAWGLWAAAGFDAVENIALLALLFGSTSNFTPLAAWTCASLKFALILLGLSYALYGLAGRLLGKGARDIRPDSATG